MRPITILLLCVALVGCEKELPVYSGKPLKRDGLLYKPNSNEPLTARVERYHENGQLEMLYTVVDGNKEGQQRKWYDNGQLEVEASYVNGKREGQQRRWHDNGQLSSEFSFVNGELNGPVRIWFNNGQPRLEWMYVNGKREGLEKSWGENGVAKPSECYKADEETDMSYCTQDKQP